MIKNKDFLFTSESVSEGHPDKVCDRISDSILDLYIDADPEARVAVETLVTWEIPRRWEHSTPWESIHR